MAEVKSLAYAVVNATDLDAWEEFGTQILGLQVGERTPDRIRFRMDHKLYRIEVNRSDEDRVSHLGWEVKGPAELAALAGRVQQAGFEVTPLDEAELKDRCVVDAVRFTDPDGVVDLELHYALHDSLASFASPLGHRFVTSNGGFGHVFQLVGDPQAYEVLYREVLGFRLSDWIDMGGLRLNFTHCNPRHHSFAFGGGVPGLPSTIGHLMLEVEDVDDVGRAHDKVLAGAAPLSMGFGRHTNDKMLSFYCKSPSGFEMEFGTGGLLIDDEVWQPTWYTATQYWGHHRNLGLVDPGPQIPA